MNPEADSSGYTNKSVCQSSTPCNILYSERTEPSSVDEINMSVRHTTC